MRICSLLPSATEIVYALGLGDSLLGVSHECDYPPEARAKRRVVRSKFDPAQLTSQEIDRLVRETVSSGGRIYEIDLDALQEIRPDLVITQALCDVCAVSSEDVQRAVVMLDMPPQVLSLDPKGLGDVLDDIQRVGEHAGRKTEARRVVAALRRRIEAVRARAAGASVRPRVACVEWLDPLIVAGHWVPEMVHLAGGEDVLASHGRPSRRATLQELVDCAPDILLLMPCGMDVDRAEREFLALKDLADWQAIPAVRRGQVYALDACGLFSRSGPRLVDGLELLGQILHPEVFPGPVPPDAGRRLEKLVAQA